MVQQSHVPVAVALDGAGWHPSAWREPEAAEATQLFDASYWTGLVAEAESGGLDFVTFADTFSARTHIAGQSEAGTPTAGPAAMQLAAFVARRTRRIGLVPTVTVTHTEPFHTSCAVATLDLVSAGRAGFCAQVSEDCDEARHFDPRSHPGPPLTEPGAHWQEAADYIEVARRLWDSWEEGAEIRDSATGRFLDADRLHHIGFRGRWFAVTGPSVTPRPPQGQPPVCVSARTADPLPAAAGCADILFVPWRDADQAERWVHAARRAQRSATRQGQPMLLFADLSVAVDPEPGRAAERIARLDRLGGRLAGDTAVFCGTPAQLADQIAEIRAAGLNGVRLHPAVLPSDLQQITRQVIPLLRARGAFRDRYPDVTLRGVLGLPPAANRFTERPLRHETARTR